VIPYFELHVIDIGPVSIPVFSLLALIGVGTGLWRGARRAQRMGVWPLVRGWFALWVVAGGFAGALLLKLVYYPYLFEANGTAEIFRFRGSSSFGGVFGGVIATWLYCLQRSIGWVDAIRIADVMTYVFPLSWAIGRLGCTLVHDHPGIRSDSWLAVRYPDWPRYDLGLLGMLFLLVLAAAFRVLDLQPRPVGFFTAAALLSCGVFRFWLDRLQVDPPIYWGWTVDQYNATVIFLAGAILCFASRRIVMERI
jgi:phosphatidylglycerol:prolipoprotein diacylglycerol transferase